MLKADSSTPNMNGFETKVRRWGATLVGFGDVSPGLAKEFRHIPRAISIAINHPPAGTSVIKINGVTAYSHQFANIDQELKNIQKKIVSYLRLMGWHALAIPPDSNQVDTSFVSRLFPLFQHKTAATCSGLGWIGKNGLLVNSRYGARLSWATVLTNAPLPVSKTPELKGRCGACTRCIDICPAGAISNVEWVRKANARAKIDVAACTDRLHKNFKILGQYICGLCIIACPVGRKE